VGSPAQEDRKHVQTSASLTRLKADEETRQKSQCGQRKKLTPAHPIQSISSPKTTRAIQKPNVTIPGPSSNRAPAKQSTSRNVKAQTTSSAQKREAERKTVSPRPPTGSRKAPDAVNIGRAAPRITVGKININMVTVKKKDAVKSPQKTNLKYM